MQDPLPARKAAARAWFEDLRDKICAAFETIEDDAPAALYPGAPGRFERTPWARGDGSEDLGGGVASMMRGRVFEKVGVDCSTVHGPLSEDFAKQVKGAGETRYFWASGISLIAHLRNPRLPAAHMNTRFLATAEWWFGGGADLNPTLLAQLEPGAPNTKIFHEGLKAACDPHGEELYPRYKTWCDEYFWLPHRGEARGVGGVFYDHHNSGDWEADFAFTRSIGQAFLETYPALLRAHLHEPWSEQERAEQLVRRGRYVEFNLLYDRGTIFGLKTGGNIESILSSMPPVVTWP